MESSVKLLVFLSCLGVTAPLCQISPANSSLVGSATQQLLGWMDRRSPSELNPSIYVGLRLSNQPSRDQDDLYLSSLIVHYQQAFISLAPDHQHKPSMGQLALYLLAVRGGCKDVNTRKGNKLVTQLKRYLEEEKHLIGHEHRGHPLTSYYQYGLAILALCIHDKKVPGHVVEKLLHAAEHDVFLHRSQYSVDTAAMASLAFSCLQASDLNPGLEPWIFRALKHVRDKILEEETPEGYFGNIYSSPLALQALMEAPSPESELACLRAGDALIKGLEEGAFQNPIPLSQLLPVLHQRTYLSLMQLDCSDERGLLEADTAIPLTEEPQNIEVRLRVQTDPQLMFLHDQQYLVPEGATLQDVLIKAQEEGWFTYETENTLSGPFVTSVMGVHPGEQQYWQLLRAPDTPLLQGIANYRPQDGETILLSLASW
ncbi:transcobalamin-2 isoform X2 [Phascolarctos cinereus]|uniref:Transcobalamin-2 n=1 Tax=Phascolarctos cinereus TaxID=38626 RepID=A0A6P5L1H9_PHACI|nr:transcobalamin-2 isoform X2 [Phascolarctos cinereus]